ncbi:glycosyltransferase family 2 protein [Yoonia sp. SS1-5]|uniref:Glycosyltransferase family 2 protein n=1 Tax=Yoonia rhodophyticola TaxID=3137370 RepID=A0AAN0M9A2_9RHOB
MRVSVIVVNYGTAALTRAAVESVLSRDHGEISVDIHVVDNASPQGDAAQLADLQSDRVTIYPEKENHGFGRGNNLVLDKLAAQVSKPDFVFLLNPDARLRNNALERMATFLQKQPKVAAVGARITKPGIGARVAAFRFPNLVNEFSGAISFGPVDRLLRNKSVTIPADSATQAVDWVAGAAVMIRFDVLQAVGGFDPAFFLYYEEVDLMRRIKDAGHEIWFLAEAEVEHEEGAATKVSSSAPERRRKPSYWYWSWQYYFRKTHGRAYALATAGLMVAGAMCNHIIARIRGRQPSAPLRFFGDFWAMAIRPLLGLKARGYD